MKIKSFDAAAILLFLGCSILPIYVFGSGGVQPAHLVLAIFSGFMVFKYGIPYNSWLIGLFLVFFYSLLVEGLYLVLGGDPDFIVHSIFFLYNFLICSAIYMYVRRSALVGIAPGIFVAGCIAVVTVILGGVDLQELGDDGRVTGTFNNPNQLGYFSVCLLSFGYLFYRTQVVGYWSAAFVFFLSLFLSVSSLSKAAMVANFVVIIIAMKPAGSLGGLVRWLLVSIIGLLVSVRLYMDGYFDDFLFIKRLQNMFNESDSSLESRGYFAFMDGNVMQMLFGLGGQGVDRVVGHEVHSTLGSMANNYGLFGFCIFSFVLIVWARRLLSAYGFVGLVSIAGPAMLYGITHNGIRFTIFWLLFSASMAMAGRSEREHLSGAAALNPKLSRTESVAK